jgi:hypothetical protein
VPAAEAPTETPAVREPDPTVVTLPELPESVFMRAMRHLTEKAGSGEAPLWKGATLGEEVTQLYRPDLSGVAFFEVRVLANGEPAGYLVLATGPHDFPIPRWNGRGRSPSDRAREEAARQGRRVARFFLLDPLTLVAEDASGERVGVHAVRQPTSPSSPLEVSAPTLIDTSTDWRELKAAAGAKAAQVQAVRQSVIDQAWKD